MPAKIKRVNVTTVVAVRNTNPPICGTLKNVEMSIGDILKCLCKRALVEEILPDGSIVKLNLNNYYMDHTPMVAASAPVSVEPEQDIERIEVEAKVEEEGGDTCGSTQETTEDHDAEECIENTVVESVETGTETAIEGDEIVPEYEEAQSETAEGIVETTVEEEVVTTVVCDDCTEIVDITTTSTEPDDSDKPAMKPNNTNKRKKK